VILDAKARGAGEAEEGSRDGAPEYHLISSTSGGILSPQHAFYPEFRNNAMLCLWITPSLDCAISISYKP
jgi:hypothetical protein